jgi:hypothetical protein
MNKDDMLALLSTLNSKLEDRAIPGANLPETFSLWWPRLEAAFSKLPLDEDAAPTKRPERELIEEILALVRSQNRSYLSVGTVLAHRCLRRLRFTFEGELGRFRPLILM